MDGAAFCPAHITGFFQAHRADSILDTGSVGAGFSIEAGIAAGVQVRHDGVVRGPPISAYVARLFLKETGNQECGADIRHIMGVPSGYGLGSSGALALSTAYALDAAFQTRVEREKLGQMAHKADIYHESGLGDVLAAYHGGFEVRVRAGAPGYGKVENIEVGELHVLIGCISPLPTGAYLKRKGRWAQLGGQMVSEISREGGARKFQRMAMEFARACGVVTPDIDFVCGELRDMGVGCGVALFGQTIFTLVPPQDVERAHAVLDKYASTIRTKIDTRGARTLENCQAGLW